MLNRRQMLAASASAASLGVVGCATSAPEALAATGAQVAPAQAHAHKIYDGIFEAMLVADPLNASGLGLDKGPRAALKSRVGDRSHAGRMGSFQPLIDARGALKTIDRSGLTGRGVTELDTVQVVSTYRASLEKALDIKRSEKGVVDAIVAQDIGKFPDLNLAESLQRIPGVVIARDAGEGRSITVRGLGPQFTRVRLNGLEAMSSVGSSDGQGGANRSRGFDFNVFASDLFSQLIVRKTASADVEEGSLGATVDLRTGRPFDYDGFTASAGW